MEDRLVNERPSGLSGTALRMWGFIFIIAGVLGRSVLQNGLLGIGTLSPQQLLEVMQSSDRAMAIATAALVMQAIETCAVPIFAFLLVEGFLHTADWKKYLIRVAAVALVSEIPYNLAMSHSVLDFGSRNPAFGLVLGLVLLYLYKYFAGKKLVCVMVTVAAVAWGWMLSIEHGIPMVLIIAALWAFRKKAGLRCFVGAAAAVICGVGSFFYMAAPMSFLAIHMYNGERGEGDRRLSYVLYPVTLLTIGLAAMFAF